MASNLSSDDRRELEALREEVAVLKDRVDALDRERVLPGVDALPPTFADSEPKTDADSKSA